MNTKLKEAMEYMDPKYIDEAVEYKAKTRNYKPLLRWGAIAACLVLVVSLSFGFYQERPAVANPTGTTAAPTTQQPTEPAKPIVLPPCRYGEKTAEGMLGGIQTLEEGIAQATAIAWIRIGNWLGEKDVNTNGKTYFEAEVIECYIGELPDSFVLKQYGSSYATYSFFPLLTYGDEMLFMLKLSETDFTYGPCYYNMGSYGTVMDVVKDAKGNAYVSDRIGNVTQNARKYVKNDAANESLKKELCATAAVYDQVQSDFIARTKYLYALEDIVEYIKK